MKNPEMIAKKKILLAIERFIYLYSTKKYVKIL